MMRRLEDEVIIVGDAGRRGEGLGNGKAAAIQFAREGAKVLCVGLDEFAAESTTNMIKNEGGEAEVCPADITKSKDCERVIHVCLRQLRRCPTLTEPFCP
jgi:NAD(P)-dependent dehydrogenase (short-subunit alcohol dehydrogenase family)